MANRVTNSMMHNLFLGDMHTNLQRLLDQQRQVTTGKKFSAPSDNPVDVVRQVALETTLRENVQYRRNMDDALTWLKNSETALNQITDVTQRIRELVIKAGNGSYDAGTDMAAIAREVEELKEELRNTANYSVEGRHLLAGLATGKPPFIIGADGQVAYVGNDGKVQYEMERGVVGNVSLNGREVFPVAHRAYSITSVEVPSDFTWQGRDEIIQIRVGDRTVKVRIPERDWADNDFSTATDDAACNPDYNWFRDPGEMDGYSLDDIAGLIGDSLEMGDVGRLVTVEVLKDEAAGTQRLQIRSHTGEPVSLTTWQETDPQAMNQMIEVGAIDDSVPGFSLADAGTLTFIVGEEGKPVTVDLAAGSSLEAIRAKLDLVDGLDVRIEGAGTASARLLVIAETAGEPISLSAAEGATEIFPASAASEPIYKAYDLSHIDLMSRLGMGTSIQSVEFASGSDVATGLGADNAIHWYLESGGKKAELLINSGGPLSLDQLADQLRAVAGEWLDVVVQTDAGDTGSPSAGDDAEGPTQRLVLRARDGGAVNVVDLSPDKGVNGTLAQRMGLSTALQGTSGGVFPVGDDLDPRMPGYMTVTVGEKEYTVSLFPEDVRVDPSDPASAIDVAKVARQIQKQVGKGADGSYLVQYKETTTGVSFYASTGEPLRFVDRPFGDPAFSDFSAGIARSLGISAGIATTVDEDLAVDAGSSGSIRIESSGRAIDIPVAEGDTLKEIAGKIRKYAGTWLDVAYVDPDLSASPSQVSLTLAAKDGSPLTIYDDTPAQVGGANAAEAFGVSTVVRGPDLSSVTVDLSTDHTMIFTVAGYEHTIDLRQLDLDGDSQLNATELAKLPGLIDSRFQGQDIDARVAADGSLILSSPRGYDFTVQCDAAGLVFDPATTGKSPEVSAQAANSPYGQTVTVRSGPDKKDTDFFGLLDQISDAMRSEDREGLSHRLLGEVDGFVDNLLRSRTQVGALTRRYETSQARLVTNHTNTTDLYSKIADTDLAEASANLMMAQAVYQASLAVIARIVQPTLVDFLR